MFMVAVWIELPHGKWKGSLYWFILGDLQYGKEILLHGFRISSNYLTRVLSLARSHLLCKIGILRPVQSSMTVHTLVSLSSWCPEPSLPSSLCPQNKSSERMALALHLFGIHLPCQKLKGFIKPWSLTIILFFCFQCSGQVTGSILTNRTVLISISSTCGAGPLITSGIGYHKSLGLSCLVSSLTTQVWVPGKLGRG